MSKRSLAETSSSAADPQAHSGEPPSKKVKENTDGQHDGDESGSHCEYCAKRDKGVASKEPLAVDNSVLVDEKQLERKQQYIEGLANSVALYKVPTVLVSLMTGYLYPNCATDDELAKCKSRDFQKMFNRCVLKDDKEKLGDYYSLALKRKSTTTDWNGAVLRMRCYSVRGTLDSCSLAQMRTLLCDLPQTDVVKLLLEKSYFLAGLALEMEERVRFSEEPLDMRRFALLKRLVNDTDDWLKILLNRSDVEFPAIMQLMSTDLCQLKQLIPTLLPNDSYRHNEDFWEEMYGQFEDDPTVYTLRGLLQVTFGSCGICENELKAIVCPRVFQHIMEMWDEY